MKTLSQEEVDGRKSRLIDPPKEVNIPVSDTVTTESLAVPQNNAGKLKIDYETMGRFDIPKVLYFEDYSVEHVNNLSLCNEENILETLVAILNDIKNQDSNCRIEDMLIEEFLETMIGIKMTYNTSTHIHKWICTCQYNVPEKERIINDLPVDLKTLSYIFIEQADESLRDFYKKVFDDMTKEEFREIVARRHKNAEGYENITIEEELKTIRIKEPFYQDIDGNIYGFNFTRIRDLLNAQNYISNKYAGRIKQIKNKQVHGKSPVELRDIREKEMDKLNLEKAKDTLTCAKALTITEYNGKNVEGAEEKIELYKKLKRGHLLEYNNFLDQMKFGIETEKEFECPECGQLDKRSLQQGLDPFEFLPFDPVEPNALRRHTGRNIFVGI